MEEFDSKELFGRWDISCREFERCINNVVEDLADCVGKIRKYKRISAVFKHKYEESTIDHNSDKICLKRIVQENERLQIELNNMLRENQAEELELGLGGSPSNFSDKGIEEDGDGVRIIDCAPPVPDYAQECIVGGDD